MLTRVSAESFACHAAISVPLSERTLIAWANGSGKSTLLACIVYALDGDFPLPVRITDMVQEGSQQALIRLHESDDLREITRSIVISSQGEVTYGSSDGKMSRSKFLSLSGLRSVLSSPEDTQKVIYGSPEARREWMDSLLLRAHAGFRSVKRRYVQTLRQRNRILKAVRDGKAPRSDIDAWDEAFIGVADEYLTYRAHLLDHLLKTPIDVLGRAVTVALISKIASLQASSEIIRSYLTANRERDMILWATHIGPHTDDLSFTAAIGKRVAPTTEAFSRWENKTLMLALKAFEMTYIERSGDLNAVIIIDDPIAELDEAHVSHIWKCFTDHQIITTTHTHTKNAFLKDGFSLYEIV